MVQDMVIVAYISQHLGHIVLIPWNSYTLTSLHHRIDATSVQMTPEASLSVIFNRSEKYLIHVGSI